MSDLAGLTGRPVVVESACGLMVVVVGVVVVVMVNQGAPDSCWHACAASSTHWADLQRASFLSFC